MTHQKNPSISKCGGRAGSGGAAADAAAQVSFSSSCKDRRAGRFLPIGILLLLLAFFNGCSSPETPPTTAATSSSSLSELVSFGAETATDKPIPTAFADYTVSFSKIGGTGGTDSVTVCKGDAMPSAEAPEKTGYTFNGYYGASFGTGTQYYDADMNSVHVWDKDGDGTIYAAWTKIEWKVVLVKAGGTGGTESVTLCNGGPMPKAEAPEMIGYDFMGYFSAPEGAGTQYYDSDMNSVHVWDKDSGGVLYAYWVEKEAKEFASDAAVGDWVYTDVLSIFPTYGIYNEVTLYCSHFVCKCKTESGEKVWIYIKSSEYRDFFDAAAPVMKFDPFAEEVKFSSPKRIYGTVTRTESIMSDLESKTAEIVIKFYTAE